MPLRNLPTSSPVALADLISCKPGQVSSMALSTLGAPCDIALLAFSEDESVSEEVYPADALYYVIEGAATITLHEGAGQQRATCEVALEAGQLLCVPTGIEHAVAARGHLKLLQLFAR